MQITNSLFIGKEFLNLEGREVKHIGTMNYYAPITTHKISKTPLQKVSLDIETDYETAELKLLGLYDGEKYNYFYNTDFINIIFNIVKVCTETGKVITYWSRLDPAVLYKQLLLMLNQKEQKESLLRYQRIDGNFSKNKHIWIERPLASCKLCEGRFEFGLMKSIRSCLLFYVLDLEDENAEPKTVWAYDIHPFYLKGLESIGKLYLGWYKKFEEELHKVKWERFDKDKDYKDRVLLSNEYDSKACYELTDILQNDFFKAFNWYPTTLISPGSLTRSCYQAMITNKYEWIEEEKLRKERIIEDLKSISIVNFYDGWKKQLGEELFKDFLCLISECYKGARIESFKNGYAKKGYIADISSAYVAEIVKLWDLRGSKVYKGVGEPYYISNAYILIRGTIDTGENPVVQYHTVLIKHTEQKNLNICALGKYRASYYWEEREELKKCGATFEDEEWYYIQTEGKPSILAEIEQMLFEMRMDLISKEDLKEKLVKTMMVSGYGVAFEAIMTYIIENAEILAQGFRAGEFFNDLNAGRITMGTRLLNFKACQEIIKNGGDIIAIMTDSITYIGDENTLPSSFWREKKVLGYYEKPEEIRDIINLGAGRYEYNKINKKTGKWDKYTGKTRGLNIEDFTGENGIILTEFKWEKLLKTIKDSKQDKVKVGVRVLITPGVVAHSNIYKTEDMGLVASERRDIDIIIGKQKRIIGKVDYSQLGFKMFDTEPIYIEPGLDGTQKIYDNTLLMFRKLVNEKSYESREDRKQMKNSRNCKAYYERNKEEKKEKYNNKYAMLRKRGLDPVMAKKMSGWKMNKIYEFLKNFKYIA